MAEDQSRQEVELQHLSGLKFKVYLTSYELMKCSEDETFKNNLIEKYYTLHQRDLIFAAASEDEGRIETEVAQISNGKRARASASQSSSEAVDEELLITLIAERPPLFNFKLPLVERCREIINKLWLEIIQEMDLNVEVDFLARKWKSIRASYLRARANVRQKIASGASSAMKLEADKIRRTHKNYELLSFLDESLANSSTVSNIAAVGCNTPLSTPSPLTPTSGTSSKFSSTGCSSAVDVAFVEALKDVSQNSPSLSATQHFCMRLAASLEKLPRSIRNRTEIKLLEIISEAEDEAGIID